MTDFRCFVAMPVLIFLSIFASIFLIKEVLFFFKERRDEKILKEIRAGGYCYGRKPYSKKEIMRYGTYEIMVMIRENKIIYPDMYSRYSFKKNVKSKEVFSLYNSAEFAEEDIETHGSFNKKVNT